jgi:hypothetical protein
VEKLTPSHLDLASSVFTLLRYHRQLHSPIFLDTIHHVALPSSFQLSGEYSTPFSRSNSRFAT